MLGLLGLYMTTASTSAWLSAFVIPSLRLFRFALGFFSLSLLLLIIRQSVPKVLPRSIFQFCFEASIGVFTRSMFGDILVQHFLRHIVQSLDIAIYQTVQVPYVPLWIFWQFPP